MEQGSQLSGACSCGRNHYIISIPAHPFESIQILYDDTAEHSRTLSLRVPLTTIHSTTYAFYPDETHNSIRRVFTPHHAPHTKRHFCGLCGTPLTHWSEETPDEAEWVYVNLSSLKNDSMEKLADAGLFSGGTDDVKTRDRSQGSPQPNTGRSNQRELVTEGREIRGNPWFEEMIEGSELGNIRKRRGGKTSSDGRTLVEYEVTEFESGDGDGVLTGTGKRKLGSLGDEDDVEMK
ncbi:hypothetical protein ACLMJK_008253 [Lecanora helva]